MIAEKKTLLFGIILAVLLDSVKSDLKTSTRILKIAVDQCAEFDIVLTEPINRSLVVTLNIANQDIVKLKSNFITFGVSNKTQSKAVTVCGHSIGHAEISGELNPNLIRKNIAFVNVSVHKYEFLNIISSIFGWIYFTAWSVAFYPQQYTNYKRKSVVGLNFDFLGLNLIGFFLYMLFNAGLYFLPIVQEQYFIRHPHAMNPIQLNDVFFPLHGFLVSLCTAVQCCMYERGDQNISLIAKIIMVLYFGILLISGVTMCLHYIELLDYLYICSYIKLSVTMIKYIPQALMNYRRKSTTGWNIGNTFCDFTGGILSIGQMIMISYNYDDWTSLSGDFTKFGLGLVSIMFDIFFFFQHYVLYRNNNADGELKKTTTNT